MINSLQRNLRLKKFIFKLSLLVSKQLVAFNHMFILSNNILFYLNLFSQLAEKNLMGDAVQQSENTHIEKVWS